MSTLPTVEELNAAFSLDRSTGVLTWRHRADASNRTNAICAGKQAGTPNGGGYLVTKLNGQMLLVHRVVFKMVYGFEPPIVDHRDRNGTNNKPENLREVDHSLNTRNRKGIDGKALPKGVYHGRDGKYRARIGIDGRRIDLGTFDSIEAAVAARAAGGKIHHQDFAREG